MLQDIRDFFFPALYESAKRYLPKQDRTSGRFLAPNGGWAITMQDPMLAYAYLYTRPGTDFYQNPDILRVIVDAAQALLDFRYPDGRMEFIKVDGSTWGPIYMCWTNLHWLLTYELLRDVLLADVKASWEEGLMPALEFFGNQDPKHVHNIPAWQAATAYHAGQIFSRPDWMENGAALLRETAAVQHPDGFWAEHMGPTTGYNNVYIHALGLYRFFSGDNAVLPALSRATCFMQAFTYPDGTGVETIDGRQKYHRASPSGQTGTTGFPGFLSTTGGVAYIRRQLKCFSRTEVSMPHTATLLWMLETLPDGYTVTDDGLPDFDAPTLDLHYGSACLTRRAGRQLTLSAYTAPTTTSRWGLDRQSFLSLWTADSAVVIGSGNSKGQLEASSFVFTDTAGRVLEYLPKAGRLLEDTAVELDYGCAVASIRGTVSPYGTARLCYQAQARYPDVAWHINVPLHPRFEPELLDITVGGDGAGHTVIRYSGVELTFAGRYELRLPSRPFNPYETQGISAVDDYIAMLSVYPTDGAVCLTITPQDRAGLSNTPYDQIDVIKK